LVACGAGSKKGGGSSAGAKPDVLFLPKAVNIPYFDAAAKGAKQAAGELNGKFKQVGPSQGTAAAQIPFINNATGQKVQSLAIAGNDPNAVAGATPTTRAGTGAAGANAGVQFTEIGARGTFSVDEFLAARKPAGHVIYPPTTLLEGHEDWKPPTDL